MWCRTSRKRPNDTGKGCECSPSFSQKRFSLQESWHVNVVFQFILLLLPFCWGDFAHTHTYPVFIWSSPTPHLFLNTFVAYGTATDASVFFTAFPFYFSTTPSAHEFVTMHIPSEKREITQVHCWENVSFAYNVSMHGWKKKTMPKEKTMLSRWKKGIKIEFTMEWRL